MTPAIIKLSILLSLLVIVSAAAGTRVRGDQKPQGTSFPSGFGSIFGEQETNHGFENTESRPRNSRPTERGDSFLGLGAMRHHPFSGMVPGHDMLNPGHNMMGSGIGRVGFGHDMLNPGHNMMGSGISRMGFGHDMLNPGRNMMGSGIGRVGFGHDMLNPGHNMMGSGISRMGFGGDMMGYGNNMLNYGLGFPFNVNPWLSEARNPVWNLLVCPLKLHLLGMVMGYPFPMGQHLA